MECNFLKSLPIGINWLVIVRVFAGLLILHHGLILFNTEAMKQTVEGFAAMRIPLPWLMAYISKAAEFFGGLLLILGLFTHFTGVVLTFNMLVALWAGHQFQIFQAGEPAFLFLLLFIVFAIVGGGRCSFDHLLFRRYNIRKF